MSAPLFSVVIYIAPLNPQRGFVLPELEAARLFAAVSLITPYPVVLYRHDGPIATRVARSELIAQATPHARQQGPQRIAEPLLAVLIDRDERQVKRWMVGTERPQFDAIFAVETLRAVLVVALAELAHDIEVITEIRVRRRRVA